jgi:hypothetical protein
MSASALKGRRERELRPRMSALSRLSGLHQFTSRCVRPVHLRPPRCLSTAPAVFAMRAALAPARWTVGAPSYVADRGQRADKPARRGAARPAASLAPSALRPSHRRTRKRPIGQFGERGSRACACAGPRVAVGASRRTRNRAVPRPHLAGRCGPTRQDPPQSLSGRVVRRYAATVSQESAL